MKLYKYIHTYAHHTCTYDAENTGRKIHAKQAAGPPTQPSDNTEGKLQRPEPEGSKACVPHSEVWNIAGSYVNQDLRGRPYYSRNKPQESTPRAHIPRGFGLIRCLFGSQH